VRCIVVTATQSHADAWFATTSEQADRINRVVSNLLDNAPGGGALLRVSFGAPVGFSSPAG
jgi:hypothetical protein